MRVGLLSTLDAPFLGYVLRALIQEAIPIHALLFDAQPVSERDRRLHHERTAGRFPLIPLSEFEALRLPCYFVADHTSAASIALVRALELDVLVNAGTPRILTPEFLRASRGGVLNGHPGLLPQFRGCACVEWAIYLDEQVGNTVHFMNEEVDGGPILLQEGLVFEPTDTYVDVRVKVHEHGHTLLVKGLKRVLTERLTPAQLPPQPPGRHFGVIPEVYMRVVVEKLARGAYAFQRCEVVARTV